MASIMVPSDCHRMEPVFGDPRYADVQKRLETELAELRRQLKVPDPDPPETARGCGRKQPPKKE